jgi:hypothetical protein
MTPMTTTRTLSARSDGTLLCPSVLPVGCRGG